jgi:hypothetical protein
MELTIRLLFLVGAVFGHSLASKPNIGEKLSPGIAEVNGYEL